MGKEEKKIYIYIYIFIKIYIVGTALLLLDERSQAQLAQYNKILENGFKNQVLVRMTTTRHDYEWIEQQEYGLKY